MPSKPRHTPSLPRQVLAASQKARPPATAPTADRTQVQQGQQPTEEEVQRACIEYLAWCGLIWLQTSRRYRPCPACGEMDHRGDGVSEGVPDLLIGVELKHGVGVNRSFWLAVEVKGPRTPLSRAQKRLQADGRIVVVRSVDELEEALYQAGIIQTRRLNR